MRKRGLSIGLVLVVVAGAIAAGVIVSLRGRAPATPNILIISIDTLRADRVGAYGHKQASTPALDRLAARGIRFTNASTTTPLTLPAHSSLFTGLFPEGHGVRDNGGFYLGADAVTLAELLKARGYRTGGFVGAFVLDGRWGVSQGFDTYFDEFDLSKSDLPGLDAIQRRGGEVVDRAAEWLAGDAGRPFFAFVHLYDPHTPYEAPEPFRSRFTRTPEGSYDAEVAYADFQVDRIVQALDRAGELDRTIIIALGDHGEALGGHGEQTHGFFVYEETIRIPLVIAGPGLPSRVVAEPVRIVDVLPTALELAGASAPSDVQGRSLVAAMNGTRLDLLAYSESWYPRHHYGWSELRAVQDGRYKFVQAPRPELYDLQLDPRETVNIIDKQPATAQALGRALDDLVARTSRETGSQAPQPVDPEVEERLRALGYVGTSVSRRALEDRPRGDPKDKILLYTLLRQAGQDSTDGRLAEAIAKVRRALAEDGEIVEAHTMLGNLHFKEARLPDAVMAYRRALELDPEHQGATMSLAMTYKAMNRLDEAEAGFQRALALDARDSKALFHLADLHMRRRRFDAAARLLTQALEAGTDRPPVLVKLGECYIELQRWDDAERTLREALNARAELPQAHYDLGLVYEARGDTARAMVEYEAELSAHPRNFSASFNLGKLLASAGRTDEALTRFRAAVDANPGFGTGHLYLAKALLDKTDLTGAERAALAGLRSDPDPAVAPLGHYVLADVYGRQGRTDVAAREAAKGRQLEERLRRQNQ
jgi:arylsulfatase A-like enzyme/Tfp pilus assembly protein PilF